MDVSGFRFILLGTLFVWFLVACKQPTHNLNNNGLRFVQFSDPEKKYSTESIQGLSGDSWDEATSPNFGRKGGYGWVKFDLCPSSTSLLWLEIPSHFTDSVLVMITLPNQPKGKVMTQAFDQAHIRPFNHRYFIFPLELQNSITHTIYLRGYVQAPDVLKMPIKLWTQNEFVRKNQEDTAGWALYAGVMLMTIVLALLGALFFSNWQLYFYFAIYTTFLTLYALSNDGWFGVAPSPYNLLDSNIILIHWLNLGFYFFVLFSKNFLQISFNTRKQPFFQPMVVMLSAEFVLILIHISFNQNYPFFFKLSFNTLGIILLLYFFIWIRYVIDAIKRKFIPVWLHLFGVLFLILFFIIGGVLINTGVFKSELSNMLMLRWALVIDVVIILISWMYRNKLLEQERRQLENEKRYHEQLALEATLKQKEEEIKALYLQNEIHQQRIRLARDLHDGIGSELTHIINKLDILALGADFNQPLESLSDYTRATNQNLRDTLWSLNQKSVSTQEWYDRTLQWLLKRWEDLSLPELITSFEGLSTLVLNPMVSLSLFRIIQEASNNTLKYANAKRFEFIFQVGVSSIEVTIRDDGCGFDKESVCNGYGLTNMESRVQELSGKISVESYVGRGTSILLTVPILKD